MIHSDRIPALVELHCAVFDMEVFRWETKSGADLFTCGVRASKQNKNLFNMV